MTLMCCPFKTKGTYKLQTLAPQSPNNRVSNGSYSSLQVGATPSGTQDPKPSKSQESTRESSLLQKNSINAPKQGVFGGRISNAGKTAREIKTPRFSKDHTSRRLIQDSILSNEFLKNLKPTQIDAVVDAMYLRELKGDSFVIQEGEIGSHLYVSAMGKFEIIKGGAVIGQFGIGVAFGELAILYNSKRQASIKVLTASKVWVLERRVFQQIMMRMGLQKIEDNVKFLRSVPLLESLNDDALAKMSDLLQVEFFTPGHFIVKQGDHGDTFYIISGGSVEITKQKPGSKETEKIGILGKGDYFGELALMKADVRQATITSLKPGVECLVLEREPFVQLLGGLKELEDKDWDKALSSRHSSESKSQKIEYEYIGIKDLELVATLGVGGFGRVELVHYRREKLTFALKCLKKVHVIEQQQEQHAYNEKAVMLACQNCPFITRLYRTYHDPKYVYFLMEPCLGGDVFTILQKHHLFEETTARFMTACVVEALEYLHHRGFIYRDLKPENLLLDSRGYIKMTDFGFAKRIGPSSKTWTFAGTPEYVAPEIILNIGHDRAVDYWALGVFMHELLTGRPPFRGSDHMKTYNQILKGIEAVHFPKHISKPAQSLIKRLCRAVATERLGYQRAGVQDIKGHRWFNQFKWEDLKNGSLKAPLIPNIKGPLDHCNFDRYPRDKDIPPDELSGWDKDF